jgi:hypothetical protein
MSDNSNLYEMRDVLAVFGSKTNIADALKLHRSAVTRWGTSIPASKQIMLMRYFNVHESDRREHARIVRARKKSEQLGESTELKKSDLKRAQLRKMMELEDEHPD